MPECDGILTFPSSYHAIRAERILRTRLIPVRTVPCPRELSSSCGVALRFPYLSRHEALKWLSLEGVLVESMVQYPERQAAPAGWEGLLQRLRDRRAGKGAHP